LSPSMEEVEKWLEKFLKVIVGLLIFPITMVLLFIAFMKRLLEWLFE